MRGNLVYSLLSFLASYNISIVLYVLPSVGRRIPIALPNTGTLVRKRNSFYLRAIIVICLILFAVLQLHLINSRKYTEAQTFFWFAGNEIMFFCR